MDSKNTKFFRKISDNRTYASISLPKSIFDYWAANGRTHVAIVYDENSDALTVSPV